MIAKFADGSPLLIEESLGEGRVLTFASAFDNLANDFPLHTSFVPFVAQTGRYLAGLQETSSSVVAGVPVELRRGKEQGASADVVDPDGRHLLSLREASTAASFEPGREGFYEVQRANGRRVLLAVHADRRESDLAPVPRRNPVIMAEYGRCIRPCRHRRRGTADATLEPVALCVDSGFGSRDR